MNKILVIEDDPNVRLNTVDLLKEEGYEVYEAENGNIGINLAKNNIPDLIISDIMMPEMDGYSVLNTLQSDILTASIPFIFLSAKTEYTDVRYGMDKGADDYLTKPFKSSDLLKAIDTRLNKKKHVEDKFNEMNDRITKNLPHELRTPLTAILGFSGLIKDNIDTLTKEEIREMTEQISSGGNRLNKHIEKFLYYSELESYLVDKEQLSVIKGTYTDSIGKVVYNAIIKTADIFHRRKDLMLDIQDGSLMVYQKHLETAVSEIVDNSCKFSEKGKPVTIYSTVEDDKYILTFIDNGKGMTDEQIKSIGVLKQFDRKNYDQPGIGLGLSVVEKIMKLYNGAINITSKPGSFTIVKLEFPKYKNSYR